MSRFTHRIDTNVQIAFGYDHMLGYFIQKFDATQVTLENEEGIVYDEDEFFSGLTEEKFDQYLTDHGISKDKIEKAKEE